MAPPPVRPFAHSGTRGVAHEQDDRREFLRSLTLPARRGPVQVGRDVESGPALKVEFFNHDTVPPDHSRDGGLQRRLLWEGPQAQHLEKLLLQPPPARLPFCESPGPVQNAPAQYRGLVNQIFLDRHFAARRHGLLSARDPGRRCGEQHENHPPDAPGYDAYITHEHSFRVSKRCRSTG